MLLHQWLWHDLGLHLHLLLGLDTDAHHLELLLGLDSSTHQLNLLLRLDTHILEFGLLLGFLGNILHFLIFGKSFAGQLGLLLLLLGGLPLRDHALANVRI